MELADGCWRGVRPSSQRSTGRLLSAATATRGSRLLDHPDRRLE